MCNCSKCSDYMNLLCKYVHVMSDHLVMGLLRNKKGYNFQLFSWICSLTGCSNLNSVFILFFFDDLALTRICDMTKYAHRKIKQMIFYDYKRVNHLC